MTINQCLQDLARVNLFSLHSRKLVCLNTGYLDSGITISISTLLSLLVVAFRIQTQDLGGEERVSRGPAFQGFLLVRRENIIARVRAVSVVDDFELVLRDPLMQAVLLRSSQHLLGILVLLLPGIKVYTDKHDMIKHLDALKFQRPCVVVFSRRIFCHAHLYDGVWKIDALRERMEGKRVMGTRHME